MPGGHSLKVRSIFWRCLVGSAKLSQSASMQGLRVGAPIDLRTGYDLLTAEARRKAMEVIERQQPKIIHMAPVCGPWSQLQNINDPADTYQKRKEYLPSNGWILRQSRYVPNWTRKIFQYWKSSLLQNLVHEMLPAPSHQACCNLWSFRYVCFWHERPKWILRLYANIFTSQFSRWHVESKRCSIKSKGESFHYP